MSGHAITFARWQDPAVWRGARFAVLGATYFCCFCCYKDVFFVCICQMTAPIRLLCALMLCYCNKAFSYRRQNVRYHVHLKVKVKVSVFI